MCIFLRKNVYKKILRNITNFQTGAFFLTKDQILEIYMNQIFPRAYGFDAASKPYFGKPPRP